MNVQELNDEKLAKIVDDTATAIQPENDRADRREQCCHIFIYGMLF